MGKALVIGSEGNIGAPLVLHLRSLGWDVLESDIRPAFRHDYVMADINHPVDLLPAFDWGPDVVFVLSAMVSRVTHPMGVPGLPQPRQDSWVALVPSA